jgi:hypothetical protein
VLSWQWWGISRGVRRAAVGSVRWGWVAPACDNLYLNEADVKFWHQPLPGTHAIFLLSFLDFRLRSKLPCPRPIPSRPSHRGAKLSRSACHAPRVHGQCWWASSKFIVCKQHPPTNRIQFYFQFPKLKIMTLCQATNLLDESLTSVATSQIHVRAQHVPRHHRHNQRGALARGLRLCSSCMIGNAPPKTRIQQTWRADAVKMKRSHDMGVPVQYPPNTRIRPEIMTDVVTSGPTLVLGQVLNYLPRGGPTSPHTPLPHTLDAQCSGHSRPRLCCSPSPSADPRPALRR